MSGAVAAERAGVETAKVSIQTVTVDGAKMTMATFRQLPVHEVTDNSGRIIGDPWGRVNYYFGECSGCTPEDHLHILGESGGALWRACYYPNRLPRYSVWMPRWSQTARWIGVVASYLERPQSVSSVEQTTGRYVVRFGDGGRFSTKARDWSPSTSSHYAERADTVLWSDDDSRIWLIAENVEKLRTLQEKRKKRLVFDMDEKIGYEHEGGGWIELADKLDAKADEADRRGRKSRDELVNLPQLYIAT